MVGLWYHIENFTDTEQLHASSLAQKLGLTKSVISAYETGLRLPSYDVLINIAKIFKVSTDYLLGMDNRQEIDLSGLNTLKKSQHLKI